MILYKITKDGFIRANYCYYIKKDNIRVASKHCLKSGLLANSVFNSIIHEDLENNDVIFAYTHTVNLYSLYFDLTRTKFKSLQEGVLLYYVRGDAGCETTTDISL